VGANWQWGGVSLFEESEHGVETFGAGRLCRDHRIHTVGEGFSGAEIRTALGRLIVNRPALRSEDTRAIRGQPGRPSGSRDIGAVFHTRLDKFLVSGNIAAWVKRRVHMSWSDLGAFERHHQEQ